MAQKLVYRRDFEGRLEGEAEICIDADAEMDDATFVGEHIARLLKDGETPLREGKNRYAVIHDNRKIGFIEILEVRMPAGDTV